MTHIRCPKTHLRARRPEGAQSCRERRRASSRRSAPTRRTCRASRFASCRRWLAKTLSALRGCLPAAKRVSPVSTATLAMRRPNARFTKQKKKRVQGNKNDQKQQTKFKSATNFATHRSRKYLNAVLYQRKHAVLRASGYQSDGAHGLHSIAHGRFGGTHARNRRRRRCSHIRFGFYNRRRKDLSGTKIGNGERAIVVVHRISLADARLWRARSLIIRCERARAHAQ